MKHIAILLVLAGFGSASYAGVDCAPGLKSAYSCSTERFRVGEVTLADVALAENAYKMKLELHAFDRNGNAHDSLLRGQESCCKPPSTESSPKPMSVRARKRISQPRDRIDH